ncbi:hypothetical protein EMPG_15232 [Blastomyces silverae]|uniref:Uncharacterized protein n=1 Tax=Blastomyces silverae TaxID=2060906 RepID=A0A0H1BD61_9EURO|nr:hypothetical protein EMPG_15232 [Blastomyces silverae]
MELGKHWAAVTASPGLTLPISGIKCGARSVAEKELPMYRTPYYSFQGYGPESLRSCIFNMPRSACYCCYYILKNPLMPLNLKSIFTNPGDLLTGTEGGLLGVSSTSTTRSKIFFNMEHTIPQITSPEYLRIPDVFYSAVLAFRASQLVGEGHTSVPSLIGHEPEEYWMYHMESHAREQRSLAISLVQRLDDDAGVTKSPRRRTNQPGQRRCGSRDFFFISGARPIRATGNPTGENQGPFQGWIGGEPSHPEAQ